MFSIISTVGQLNTDLEVKACCYSKVSKTYWYGRTYAFAVGFRSRRNVRAKFILAEFNGLAVSEKQQALKYFIGINK